MWEVHLNLEGTQHVDCECGTAETGLSTSMGAGKCMDKAAASLRRFRTFTTLLHVFLVGNIFTYQDPNSQPKDTATTRGSRRKQTTDTQGKVEGNQRELMEGYAHL